MTLSSLQAQAPRVILSGFSPSNCTEKTKRKPIRSDAEAVVAYLKSLNASQ
jgi:hypothetical protein